MVIEQGVVDGYETEEFNLVFLGREVELWNDQSCQSIGARHSSALVANQRTNIPGETRIGAYHIKGFRTLGILDALLTVT